MSSVAEQRGTKRVKTQRALSPKILLDLVRQPLWVIAIGGSVLGFALQVVALRYGPLALVEPLLVCDLIFAVIIASYLRRRFDPVIFSGVLATAAGVAGFLVIGRPTNGVATVGFFVVLPLAAGLVACIAGCLAVAKRSDDLRPLALALACGICYGTAAFLVKLVVTDVSGGLPHVLSDWPIYALAIVGPAGFVLNQDAFQQGTLLAPVLAIITACDPIISIALAYLWLNERLSSSPAAIAGEVIALLVMVTGIYVLAHHSPMVMAKPDAPDAMKQKYRDPRLRQDRAAIHPVTMRAWSASIPGITTTRVVIRSRRRTEEMVKWDDVTHADVVRAIKEYDRLGAEKFYAKHGFAPTTTYELVWEAHRYPPRAILGTAYEFATGQRLASGDFEGGKSGAVRVLGKLGFTVEEKHRPAART
jgi:drug/metabolite transporter (DMT)-like permease